MRTSDVVKAFGGSKTAVAEALGISISAVSQWQELVPPLSAMNIAKLRPDLEFDLSVYEGWNKSSGRKRKRKH